VNRITDVDGQILAYTSSGVHTVQDNALVEVDTAWRSYDEINQARDIAFKSNKIYQLSTDNVLAEFSKTHDYGFPETIIATDFDHMLLVTTKAIYSLEDFSEIGPMPKTASRMSRAFFDADGNLYFTGVVALYRLDQRPIGTYTECVVTINYRALPVQI